MQFTMYRKLKVLIFQGRMFYDVGGGHSYPHLNVTLNAKAEP